MEQSPIVGYEPNDEGASVERVRTVDQWMQEAEDLGLTAEEIDRVMAALTAMRERAEGETAATVAEAETMRAEEAES
jgi:hypothetical protein